MSKLCCIDKKKHHEKGSDSAKRGIDINESTVCLGATNIKLWNELKTSCKYNSDVKFTSFLLNLAQKHLTKRKNDIKRKHSSSGESLNVKSASSHRKNKKTENNTIHKHSHNTKRSHSKTSHRKRSHENNEEHKSSKSCDKEEKNKNKRKSDELDKTNECVNDKLVISDISEKNTSKQIIDFPIPMVVVENLNLSLENLDKTHISINENDNAIFPTEKLPEPYLIKEETNINSAQEKHKNKYRKKHKNTDTNQTKHKHSSQTKRKVKHHDIRKAPQLDLNIGLKPEIKNEIPVPIPEPQELIPEVVEEIKTEHQRVAIKIKLCNTCNTRHLQDTCPIKHPNSIIFDSITINLWNKNYNNLKTSNSNTDRNENIEKSDDSTSAEKITLFAESSLPSILYLEQSESAHGLGVFAKEDIKEYTKFGPLIGEDIKEVDIAEDSSMRHIWEVYADKNNIYINTENGDTSNWIRYIRPAPNRDLKNLLAISDKQKIFMITTRDISSGEELLYWQDDSTGSNKKKMEKTNCGGCNLSFTHPLYYRVHCSIFHDIRYSLTIRKYHCKICGAAILGKDNIMKHAMELHNGQGAYQCQFCKKFFLRLNYLEMHRTYGCAANPHRSRPLCDFCGRKFCQPQKLKVHIKRMHSDMSEVLREFQCKSCLKLLGSRAALQRHVKEVHQKQIDDSCTCVRCGKLFQNKSNLKIHMLTHSGVKPFKCKEDNCSAAFTTKQCLQFHYKKVHGFAEEIMPKIERSVEYTFAAYAGVKNPELGNNDKNNKKNNEDLMCLDDSTDVDDISLDDKNLDDPPALHSPIAITSEQSSRSNQTPPMLETYTNTRCNSKIQSKGSKKWLGEDSSHSLNLTLQQPQKEVYQEIQKPAEPSANIMLEVEETQSFDRNKISMNLNVYNRHESSNASLLVEAALDSVSDIQITSSEHNVDVNGSQSCTDSLVNNLYSLSHQDNLPDVTYNHSEDLNESRDINLISPSVNDHISVTDHDLNDDIPNRGITLDYSNLHHNEYNIHGANSPGHTPRSRLDYTLGHDSEIVSPGNSPPRYDFHHTPADNLSSDESNGIVAQNLSLNNSKDKLRLDLVGYKSHYNDLDSSDLSMRTLRQKYDLENERNKMYDLEVEDRNRGLSDIRPKFDITNATDTIESDLRNKSYSETTDHSSELKLKQFEVDADFRNKYHEEDNIHNKYESIDSKYDSDIRNKQIEIDSDRNKTYETSLESEIRNKSYDVMDNLELRTKAYDNVVDTDFRTDRNFEPLVLNPAELQGLDMSARSYHNFHTSGAVQGINRYHHIYSELDRPSVDLRLGYSPPPPYTHSDVLRVVSLDLTPPGRHSVDLSLRSHALHSHQLPNSRLLTDHPLQTNRLISSDHNLTTNRIISEHNRLTLDQSRLLTNEHNLSVSSNRLLGSDTRLLSDHTTNRLLSNDQLTTNRLLSAEQGRMLTDDTRLLTEQTRLLDQSRLLGDTRILQTPSSATNHDLVPRSSLSPAGYTGYPVSPSPYHASSLARTHGNSPGHTPATSYHHYSTYY